MLHSMRHGFVPCTRSHLVQQKSGDAKTNRLKANVFKLNNPAVLRLWLLCLYRLCRLVACWFLGAGVCKLTPDLTIVLAPMLLEKNSSGNEQKVFQYSKRSMPNVGQSFEQYLQSDGSAIGFRARGGARDLLSQAQDHEQGAQGSIQGGVPRGVNRAATPLNQHFIEQGALSSELRVSYPANSVCVVIVTRLLQGSMVSITCEPCMVWRLLLMGHCCCLHRHPCCFSWMQSCALQRHDKCYLPLVSADAAIHIAAYTPSDLTRETFHFLVICLALITAVACSFCSALPLPLPYMGLGFTNNTFTARLDLFTWLDRPQMAWLPL